MNFNHPLYYCSECKTVVPELANLLFIEENSNKGFCSETCIEDFYLPLVRHYENLDQELRKKLNISLDENIQTGADDKQLVEEILSNPSEVWNIENELHEKLTTYFRHFQDFTAVLICTIYNGEASFIFLCSKTRSREYLAVLRNGHKPYEAYEQSDNSLNDEDLQFMQLLESKKSNLLAELLTKRKDNDISFEDFTHYEYCYSECLESPDEVFEVKDRDGDVFFVYIKSFLKDHLDFFYIISCLKRKDLTDSSEVNVFPVLAFPTNDLDLYSNFREGTRISGTIKN